MLEKMRSHSKNIIMITAGSFVLSIFLVWGMDITSKRQRHDDTIGEIFGKKIKWETYYTAMQNAYSQYMDENDGQAPDEQAVRQMRDEVWNEMVNNAIFAYGYKQRDISVSDEELAQIIVDNPPQFIQEHEAFLDENGNFDQNRYLQALQNPQMDWGFLESGYREQLLKQRLY